ncbi:MAG: 30S ribosome-binding factor RbfA [Clostridia bacterium]|nr:30S ribosome-binding factor RbfA [Clostridia bacterium]
MARYRRDRVNESVKEETSLILRDVKDPRVAGKMISVTSADVSGDLKFAKIYYSVLEEHDPREVSAGLKGAAGYIRKRLAETLNLRITPELSFIEDSGVKHGADIAAILRDIGASGGTEGEEK